MADDKDRYPRVCPVCRSAMVGERTRPEIEVFDRFVCLACGTVIEEPTTPEEDE